MRKSDRDPITLCGAWLVKECIASETELSALRDTIEAEAREAVQYALDAPYPDGSQVGLHVFAEAS